MCVARQIYCYTKHKKKIKYIKTQKMYKKPNRKILWNYDHLSQIFLYFCFGCFVYSAVKYKSKENERK